MYIGEKCFVCLICNKCFMRSDYLSKYIKIYNCGDGKKLDCNLDFDNSNDKLVIILGGGKK